MKDICQLLGAALLAATMMLIPVVTYCSFIYDWMDLIKALLIVICIVDWIGIADLIISKEDLT